MPPPTAHRAARRGEVQPTRGRGAGTGGGCDDRHRRCRGGTVRAGTVSCPESYRARRTGSRSTPYAMLTRLNRSTARRSPRGARRGAGRGRGPGTRRAISSRRRLTVDAELCVEVDDRLPNCHHTIVRRENVPMSSWGDLETAAPELAAAIEQRFADHKHALLATLRRDGSPRISGLETTFRNGELWLAMMPDSTQDGRPAPRPAVRAARRADRPRARRRRRQDQRPGDRGHRPRRHRAVRGRARGAPPPSGVGLFRDRGHRRRRSPGSRATGS